MKCMGKISTSLGSYISVLINLVDKTLLYMKVLCLVLGECATATNI